MAAPQTADGSPLRSGRFAGAPRTIERVSPSRSPGLRVIACAGLPGAGAPVACRRRSPRTVAGAATASACSGRPVFPFNPAGPELGQRHIRAGPVPRQWPGQGRRCPPCRHSPRHEGRPPDRHSADRKALARLCRTGPGAFRRADASVGSLRKIVPGMRRKAKGPRHRAGLIPRARFRPGACGACPSGHGGSGPFSRRRPGPIP